jgi:predicted nucleotidyltransferase
VVRVSEIIPAALAMVEGEVMGLVLFGSHARDDPGPDSDVDVLQLAPSHRASYQKGNHAFSVYTLRHLAQMARDGSLFVRHVLREGRGLDAGGKELLRYLAVRYRAPRSYAKLLLDVREASALLDVTGDEYRGNWAALNRLAVHLLRSALYARAHDEGFEDFAVAHVQVHFGDCRIVPAVGLRNAADPDFASFCRVRELLGEYCGGLTKNPYVSSEALIVNSYGSRPLTVILGLRLLGDGSSLLVYEDVDLASRVRAWPDSP